MCYIELCNKKDRLPGSFRRQSRMKTWNLVPVSIDGNGNAIKNCQIFKFKRIHLIYLSNHR